MSPASLWMGAERPRRLLYVTKLAIYRWIVELLRPDDPLLVYGCGGLPSTEVCRHVRATQQHFGVPVFFLGDLDPGDLTVFLALWRGDPSLKASPERLAIRHLGVGDGFLRLFRRRLAAAQLESSLLAMTPGEVDHLRLIRELAGNIEAFVGPGSMRLLERGKKLEVEGLLRWAQPGTRLREELREFLLSATAARAP